MKLRSVALVIFMLAANTLTGINQANAGLIFQQNSEANPTNPTGLPNAYRIVNIETTVDSDNTDLLQVKVNLLENPRADLFATGTTRPILRIKIFKKYSSGQPVDGGYGDVWIDSPATAYQFMGVQSPAPVTVMRAVGASQYDPRISLPECTGKTWLETFGQEPWVKFSVSMSCIKLPDKFSVLAFVDADLNASYQVDYKFAPAKPMAVDVSAISRPRPKDSQVASISRISTYDLRTKSINVSASAQRINLYGDAVTSNALAYNSLTPTICAFPNSSQNTLNLLSKGTCTVEAYAVGDNAATESNRAQTSFTVDPIPKQSQTLSYYEPNYITEGDRDFILEISASSGLPVRIVSLEPGICLFKDPENNPRLVTVVGPGTCVFDAEQSGSDLYFPTSGRGYFDIEPRPVAPTPETSKAPDPVKTKKPVRILGGTGSAAAASQEVKTQEKTDAVAEKAKVVKTIKCKKGKSIKTVPGSKCPAGYKKY